MQHFEKGPHTCVRTRGTHRHAWTRGTHTYTRAERRHARAQDGWYSCILLHALIDAWLMTLDELWFDRPSFSLFWSLFICSNRHYDPTWRGQLVFGGGWNFRPAGNFELTSVLGSFLIETLVLVVYKYHIRSQVYIMCTGLASTWCAGFLPPIDM